MLASSPLFSTTYGWPLENLTTQNLQQNCNVFNSEYEANSYNPLLDFGTYDHKLLHDSSLGNSVSVSSEGAPNDNSTCDDPMIIKVSKTKNLNHNASERDRRKRVNELYAFLRSLLPVSTNQKKKVSIPQTVSRTLKYIPELQKEVEALRRKKQKLSSFSSSTANTSQDFKIQNAKEAISTKESSVISSVQVMGDNEVLIQLIYTREHMRKNKDINGLLSKVVEYFEQQEEGFILLNSTTSIGLGEMMSLNTLHLETQGDKRIEVERLKEKIHSFHQQSDKVTS